MSKKGIAVKLLKERTMSLGITVVVICIASAIIWPISFATFDNISRILLGVATNTIVAIGMMLLLISGDFDLSVGSVMALSGGVAAKLMVEANANFLLATLAGLICAVLVGLTNALLITKVGINGMVQTLAMMGIVRGLTLITVDRGIMGFPEAFNAIGQGKFLGLRLPIWYMIVIAVLLGVLSSKTVFFKRYYYIGGNPKAAFLSGIYVKKMKIIGFVLCAFLSGLAGIILTSRMGAANSTAGQGIEMTAITAAILGGASMQGGKGTVLGAVLGSVFMGLVNNIMIIARVTVFWQDIVLGIILILAVSLDSFVNRKSA